MAEGDFELFNGFSSAVSPEFAEEGFTFSCLTEENASADFDDHDLFFDMDVTLPFNLDGTTGNVQSKATGLQDFEFSMPVCGTGTTESTDDVSPADDLFYKGQLLPLHLPPRLQMVENLSSPDAEEIDKISLSSFTLSCYLQPDDQKDSVALNTDQEDAREELRSNSIVIDTLSCDLWSSGHVKDSEKSDSTESSRSSQDSCFDNKVYLPDSQDPYVFPNCYKDPTLLCRSQTNDRQIALKENAHPTGTRKPYLKWRLHLPGLKRSVRLGVEERSADRDCTVRLTDSREQRRSNPGLKFKSSVVSLKSLFGEIGKGVGVPEDGKDAHEVLEEKTLDLSGSKPAANVSHPKKMSSVSDIDEQHEFVSKDSTDGDRDKPFTKARDHLHKYLRILKPLFMKLEQKIERAGLLANFKMEEAHAAKRGAKDLHHARESEGQVHHQSFSGNLRATSFSRRSSGSTSISPNHSGVLRASSSSDSLSCSTNMELQSAIQGAIAHCKQSQGG